MDLTPFQRAWPQLGVGAGDAQPLTHGTNNLVFHVKTDTGAYALHILGAHVSPRRLQFEHDVLTQLRAMRLPFALPIPLLTEQGESYARIRTAEGTEALATLTPYIAGRRPRRDDLAQAESAGMALGLLDEALAHVTPAQPDVALDWRSVGDLTHCHPLVPEPPAALAELPLPVEALARLLAGYDTVMAQCSPLYASLPRQLSHEDYDPGNLLMEDANVTGVLDWEFCALDLRPMDLVVALTWWPVERFGTGDEWPIISALLRGYARRRMLNSDEVVAILALFQLRAYTSLIHRLGRQRQGLSPMEHVTTRAWAALEREDWLKANSERLIHAVDEALRRADAGA